LEKENKTAVITGVYGQDGSYLAEYLLSLNYTVYGVSRPKHTGYIPEYMYKILEHENFKSVSIDVIDAGAVFGIVNQIKPDEYYNLAAISFIPISWDNPSLVLNINTIGTLNALEAIRTCSPNTKFYQASSSEMFGNSRDVPQHENTPMNPESPYAISKVTGHNYTNNYKDSYGIFAVSGLAFNHESPRRRKEFVTRKITNAVVRIKAGLQDKLFLGNISAKRDWGLSADYVKAMWLMLQNSEPTDFVIGTGIDYSVEDFCKEAFSYVNLDYTKYVEIDEKYIRPVDVQRLLADPSMIEQRLNWVSIIGFSDLVSMMMEHDKSLVGLH